MKKTMFALTTIYLLWTAVVAVLTGEAATTFAGAIVSIDQAQRTITFQTMDGQTWALAVADSNILKQERVAKGDRVRIEVDLSGKITKITKISKKLLSDQPLSEPTQFLDEVRP
jgi:hypothetical protein